MQIAGIGSGSSVHVLPAIAKEAFMKPQSKTSEPVMAEEYDFSQGVRGKYAGRYAAGSNIVLLAPDVAAAFPDSDSVNEALRLLIKIARQAKEKIND
jgi:hypothetical protein